MKIEMYTRHGCGQCENVKKIFKSRSISFTEHRVDVDVELSVVKEKYPQAKALPVIVVDDNWVEHLAELRTLLEKS